MIKFEKLQGTGNDFIIFKAEDLREINYSELAKKSCNRHLGIGADGMIIVDESDYADIKMIFYNSDGSEATMCGNGIRCFSKFVFDNNIVNSPKFEIETLAGIMKVEIYLEDNNVNFVKVNLGKPVFISDEIPKDNKNEKYIDKEITIEGQIFKISSLIIGTIHTVLFIDKDFDNLSIERIGRLIENHDIFPQKTNVNFCKIIDEENMKVVTWEKGAGLTLACGTGAAASFIVSRILYNCNREVNVKVKAGTLFFEDVDDYIFMNGPVKLICKGEYNEK